MDEPAALRRACVLAARGVFEVEPNPPVGAVLLRDGAVLAEGWHRAFGGPHAEIEALSALGRAGGNARDATLCVSLEPCSTTGKTGPCTEAVLAAGIRRVVAGAVDPHPDHAGAGLRRLEEAGVEVVVAATREAAALLDDFRRSLARRRPYVVAKWAMSRDGAIAGPGREPVALSGPTARAETHRLRAHLDAIVVGATTVRTDDPLLTARGDVAAVRPLRRVVLDPRLRTPPTCRLVLTAGEVPTWIATAGDADPERARVLEAGGARVLRVPAGGGWLEAVLSVSYAEGVRRLLVEGGSETLARALRAHVVDQVRVILCPRSLGPGALPAVAGCDLSGCGPAELADRLGLEDVEVRPLGDDVLVVGRRPSR